MAKLSEEQEMLRDMAQNWVRGESPIGAWRKQRDADTAAGYDSAVYGEMAAMGWTGITIAEAHGGSDFGWMSLGLVVEESARAGAELELAEGVDSLLVPGVAKLLRRLVRNLLENARRYGGAAGTAGITVIVGREDGNAVLRVCDRGPGVPPEQRERIFEPFYRLPGASEREGGVGLGLALVKSIAERHGGSVGCEAREGGGACFTVRLPSSAS